MAFKEIHYVEFNFIHSSTKIYLKSFKFKKFKTKKNFKK